MLAIITLLTLSADPAGYGDVTGRFVLKGAVPVLPPLVAKGDLTAKDPHVAAVEGVPDESLVVDPETKGIANVVLWVRRFRGDPHPRYEEAGRPPVRFGSRDCRFVPHVHTVHTPQTVLIYSDDDCAHNTRAQFVRNVSPCVTIPPNETDGIEVTFDQPEPVPMPIKCDIHGYESAYMLVLDHPYSAVTDSEGRFTIEDLPAGRHTLRVWHERVGYLEKSLEVTVDAGETLDLGDKPVRVGTLLEKR